MKKSIILGAALSLFAALPSMADTLPSGVRSVDPTQGRVDLTNNVNPLGVSEIAVTFRSTPEVNKECTALIGIYVDGANTPAETMVAGQSVYVDNMGMSVGGFKFKKKYTAPGTYRVIVPEGAWLVNGNPSPALALDYNIKLVQTMTPAAGVIEELSKITLFFPEATGVTYPTGVTTQDQASIWYTKDSSYYYFSCSSTTTAEGTTVDMTIVDEHGTPKTLTELGNYNFFMPKGVMESEYADGTTDKSDEINVTYTIPEFIPGIKPAEGKIAEFNEFELIFPENFTVWTWDNKDANYIYPVVNGTVDTYNPIARAFGTSRDPYMLKVENGPVIPEDGVYCLQLSSMLYFGQYNGDQFINGAPCRYYYTIGNVGTGVSELEAENDGITRVYDINGLYIGANPQLDELPAGIYIINGKKVMIRR